MNEVASRKEARLGTQARQHGCARPFPLLPCTPWWECIEMAESLDEGQPPLHQASWGREVAGAVLRGLLLLAFVTLIGAACGKAWRRWELWHLWRMANVSVELGAGGWGGWNTEEGFASRLPSARDCHMMKRSNSILEAAGGLRSGCFWGVLCILIFHSLLNSFLIFDTF